MLPWLGPKRARMISSIKTTRTLGGIPHDDHKHSRAQTCTQPSLCCRKLLLTSAFSLFSTPTHQAASENQHPPRFQRILSILVSSESEVCAGDGGVPFRTRKGVHLPFGIEPKLHVRRRGLKRKKLKARRTSAISKPRRRINGYIYK